MWTRSARWGAVLAVAAFVAIGGGAALHDSDLPSGGPAGVEAAPAALRAPVASAITTAAAAQPGDRCGSGRVDAPRRIVVDLSEQRLWLCEGRRELLTSPVTTGKDRSPTPTGRWFVHGKQDDEIIQGPGYRRHVDHWMPYFQGYGFHDASWQRLPFGDVEGRALRGSHGCVRVPGPAMAELFRRSPLGTVVIVTD